ncbi:unnamed protein product, partial [Mesorhabditis spiculigera]
MRRILGYSRSLKAQKTDIKALRNERGHCVLKLFQNTPTLVGNSSTRLPSALLEREEQWSRIAEHINDRYSGRLSPVNTERVKKIHMYYRKRESKMRARVDVLTPEADVESPLKKNIIHEDGDCFVMDVNADTSESATDEDQGVFALSEENLQAIIEAIGADPQRDNASPALSYKSLSQGSCENRKLVAHLKKERSAMVDQMAKYYLKRLCFDGTNASIARSQNINQERHSMWKHISDKINAKYAEQIGYLTVEQTKKLFSNLKRKSRAKKDEDGRDDSNGSRGSPDDSMMDEDFSLNLVRDVIARENIDIMQGVFNLQEKQAERSPSVASSTSSSRCTRKDFPVFDSSVFSSPPASSGENRLDELLRGLDKTLEAQLLREQLTEKEQENQRLKRKIEEQAEEHKKKILAMIELVALAVDRKASDEVRTILSL